MKRNFAWTFVGNLVFAATQWALLILITRLGSPEMLGRFALAQAICVPVIMFLNLNLRALQTTDQQHEFQFAHYLGLRLSTVVFGLPLIALIVWVGFRVEILGIVLAMALMKSAESLNDTYYGLLQKNERMRPIAISSMARGLASMFAIFLGISLLGDVTWGLVGASVLWLSILVLYDIPRGREALRHDGSASSSMRPRFDAEPLRRLALLALPLGFITMLQSLGTYIPTFFIDAQLGERGAGLFAAAAYLMLIGSMVCAAMGRTVSPRLARYAAHGQVRDYLTLAAWLFAAVCALGLIQILTVWLAGEAILHALYGPVYAEQNRLLFWLIVAGVVAQLAGPIGTSVSALRVFKAQTWVHALRVISLTVLCATLIPVHDLMGGAWALLGSGVVLLSTYAVLWSFCVRNLITKHAKP